MKLIFEFIQENIIKYILLMQIKIFLTFIAIQKNSLFPIHMIVQPFA